jgi:hypothetical protein
MGAFRLVRKAIDCWPTAVSLVEDVNNSSVPLSVCLTTCLRLCPNRKSRVQTKKEELD